MTAYVGSFDTLTSNIFISTSLQVTGTSQFDGMTTHNNGINASTLTVTGDSQLNGALAVGGTITAQEGINTSTLTVTSTVDVAASLTVPIIYTSTVTDTGSGHLTIPSSVLVGDNAVPSYPLDVYGFIRSTVGYICPDGTIMVSTATFDYSSQFNAIGISTSSNFDQIKSTYSYFNNLYNIQQSSITDLYGNVYDLKVSSGFNFDQIKSTYSVLSSSVTDLYTRILVVVLLL
jgi:hypothetical protein